MDFSPSMQEMFLLRGAKIGLCLGFAYVLGFVSVCFGLVFFDLLVGLFFHAHIITLFCPISNFEYLIFFLLLG